MRTTTTSDPGRTAGSHAATAEDMAPGVRRVRLPFANAYLVGERGRPWVLVDTGTPLDGDRIRHAAEACFGPDARPHAIVLTHGHGDHAGSVLSLARHWDTTVYAHPLELPFLTGLSDYPPPDPTVGGAIAFLSRFAPHHGYDLGERIDMLPGDGSVPGLPRWRWIHTPGHTPGHVSLFRGADRVLLAGDALSTMDLDSWTGLLTHPAELHRPPAPFTPDWEAAAESVARLAELEPLAVGAGHGTPMSGAGLPGELRSFAGRVPVPDHGRYVARPARADEHGVAWLPPAEPDPLPARLLGAAALIGVAALIARRILRRRRD